MRSQNEEISYSLAPWLPVENSIKALAFYKAAFSAVETYKMEVPGGVIAKLSVHGAEFWIAHEKPSAGGPAVRFILTVPDPDASFAQAVRAGASEIFPVGKQHGWRLGRVVDPFGYHWEIGRPIEN